MKLSISQIQIDPRIRIDYSKVDEIAESMSRLGQIAPIIVELVDKKFYLVDGGQRLRAAEKLGWTGIEYHELSELDPLKRIEIEFEANEKRSGFSWQERCLAYLQLNRLKGFGDPSWTRKKLSDIVGKSIGHVQEALSVAEALERTRGQKNDWEIGLWKCENIYTAVQYLAMINENLAFAEIERRKTAVAIKLGLQKPAEPKPLPELIQNLNITMKERPPFKVDIHNRMPIEKECQGCLVFSAWMPLNVTTFLDLTGAALFWLPTIQGWSNTKEQYTNNGSEPLAFPLIWNSVRGRAIEDCPFYINYKLGLFIPMFNQRSIEPLPAVITAPQNSPRIPIEIIQYSLDAISREGDKIWLPSGGPVVEVAQCGRIPIWKEQNELKNKETLEELKTHYIETHGKCEFTLT